jgi:hypothetical protein
MSADNVTPIKGNAGQSRVIAFHNIERPLMDPELALHSQHALFYAIRVLLGDGTPDQEDASHAQQLAFIGEHLADQLTDRL